MTPEGLQRGRWDDVFQ